eukprot:sb/3461969/
MSDLAYISMTSNKISRINDDDFANTPALKRLVLACNEITFVGDGAFEKLSKLEALTLGVNYLSSVPTALSAIKSSLIYAGLEHNAIATLPKLPFGDMAELRHINMTGNQVGLIEKDWHTGVPNLAILELVGNPLTVLNSSSFYNLTKLTYLGLHQCKELTAVEGRVFEDLPALMVLEMNSCPKLRDIDYRAFRNTGLKYIDLSSNMITSFPHGLFIEAEFTKLVKLRLSGNGMKTLSEFTPNSYIPLTDILRDRFPDVYPLSIAFGLSPTLQELDLSSNMLTVIPDGVLNCFKDQSGGKTNILDLSNNKISTVEEFAFTEMKLTRLDMSNNRLGEVPRAMYHIKQITEFKLSTNLLTFLEAGVLSEIEVNRIFLDDNQILTIENGALPSSLVLISMTENLFNFVDTDQFSNMPSLESIDLSNNRITILSRNVFANNGKLASITLDNNQISWLDQGVFDDCAAHITKISIENNGLAFVHNGTLSNKELSDVKMANNRLHEWPSDGSLSSQSNPFTADFSRNNFEVIRKYMFRGHQQLVVVLAVEDDQEPLPCGKIVLSETGDSVTVIMGTLDMGMVTDSSNRCILNDPGTVTQIEGLEIGGVGYLQIFTTQRRSGTSQVFLRMVGWVTEEWANFRNALEMSEAKVRNGLVDTLDFRTVLGNSTSYTVTTLKANDNFEIHESDFETTEDPAPPEAKTNPGYGVPVFYNCSDAVTPVAPVTPADTVTITTDEALEFVDGQDTLIDRTQLSLDLTGTQINVQDADDGENKRIQYFTESSLLKAVKYTLVDFSKKITCVFTGGYTVKNLDEDTYEEYRTVKDYFTFEENMVEYSVDVYAVDSGSPVRFGSVNRFVLARLCFGRPTPETQMQREG